jgi:hypothetical protein
VFPVRYELNRCILFALSPPAWNRVPCAVGNLDTCTPVRELHVAFKIPCVYDYITKLCRTQAEANPRKSKYTWHRTREVMHKKYERLTLCGGQAYDRSAD